MRQQNITRHLCVMTQNENLTNTTSRANDHTYELNILSLHFKVEG